MAYTIHELGKEVQVVNSKTDAIFHLGAKYGAILYNAALKLGFITFLDEIQRVKIRPFDYEIHPCSSGAITYSIKDKEIK